MKEFKLISFNDLGAIAVYLDRIDDLFPVKSVPELAPLRNAAHLALSNTLPSGNEGIIHAKLDAILNEMNSLNGRFAFAEQVAGPPQAVPQESRRGIAMTRSRLGAQNIQGIVEQSLKDLEFDEEGGEVL